MPGVALWKFPDILRALGTLYTTHLHLTVSWDLKTQVALPEREVVEEALGCVDWAEQSSEVVLKAAGHSGPVLLHYRHHTCLHSVKKHNTPHVNEHLANQCIHTFSTQGAACINSPA